MVAELDEAQLELLPSAVGWIDQIDESLFFEQSGAAPITVCHWMTLAATDRANDR
jgi:hypothetical protein